MKPGIRKMDMGWVSKYGDIVGTYEGAGACLIVKDAALLKQVLVKDFDYFTNRRYFLTGNPISDSFLTVLIDDDWKRVRSAISPAFSASKLKNMNKGINDCCRLLTENLHEESVQDKEIEMKDMCGSFTIDLIAKTGFGVDINSQKEKDKSPFVINSKKLFNQNVFALPLIILLFFFPKLGTFLVKIFKISFFPRGVLEFFTNVVKQMVNNRTENEGKHTDLLQMMISSQNNDQLANGT